MQIVSSFKNKNIPSKSWDKQKNTSILLHIHFSNDKLVPKKADI